jgi:hypothetical protein
MRLKVISDGTLRGTRVVDRDNPDRFLEGVQAISWSIDAEGKEKELTYRTMGSKDDIRYLATAVLKVQFVELEITGEINDRDT